MVDYTSQVDALFPDIVSETTKETEKDTAKLFGKDVGVSSLGSFLLVLVLVFLKYQKVFFQ